MLEAVAIVAGSLKAPIAHRLRTAASRQAKATKDDRRREIVAKVAGPIVRKHPTWTCWRIAGEDEGILKQVNDELEKHHLGRMGRDAITDHLKALWPHLDSRQQHAG
jgi:hypothetical protein